MNAEMRGNVLASTSADTVTLVRNVLTSTDTVKHVCNVLT